MPKREFDVSSYQPKDWNEVVYLESVVPERVFVPGETAKWVASLTSGGVIVINLIHADYPDAVCQIQCSPDSHHRLHTFFQHVSPTKRYIPDDLAEKLFTDLKSQVFDS